MTVDRGALIAQLSERFDILIIGDGATGLAHRALRLDGVGRLVTP